MAFIEHDIADQERFNLLLLEPGEIYFEDYSVTYFPNGTLKKDKGKKSQKGHLKICSKSVVFVPKVIQFPILKLPLKNVTSIEEWSGDLFSRLEKDKIIKITSNRAVKMKENNIIGPYSFFKEASDYTFQLDYASVDDCLPQICQLHRASTLPPGEQTAMINAIVLSRQSRCKFNTSWLEDLYEKIQFQTQGDRILPLVTNPGRIMLTCKRLYFQPFNNIEKVPVIKIRLKDISRVIKRRFLLRHVGIEIFCKEGTACSHIYLSLQSANDRNELYDTILKQEELQLEETSQDDMMIKWQSKNLSNYDYLMYLNSQSDRSFCDLTQYPVMPWVITDFTSPTLDLEDEKIYRDLRKPIGALNEERIQKMRERYREMPDPKFLYGSHYSTPGYVLFYLARIAPEYVLCLQNGKFDKPDRMFNSLDDTWGNCLEGAADFKELIPEFFDGNGEFLLNKGVSNFGIRQDGRPVGDVELPPWAKDYHDFIDKMRAALESDYASEHIHHWIDLIFGYKQRGKEAEKADNVFYYMTYEGAVDLDKIEDPNERARIEIQIMEFGQTPHQLFEKPHPPRFTRDGIRHHSSTTASCSSQENELQVKEAESIQSSESGVVSSVQSCLSLEDISALQITHQYSLHKSCITAMQLTEDGCNIFSVSQDTTLKMYSLEDQRQLSFNVSNMALSSCIVMPDNRTIVVGSWDNFVYFYSVEFGRTLDTLKAHDDAVSSVVWKNNFLITASWDSTAKVWQFDPPSEPHNFNAAVFVGQLDHDSGVSCQDIDETGSLLATGTEEGHVLIWDIKSLHPIAEMEEVHSGTVNSLAFTFDSRRLISCGADSVLKILDVETQTEVFVKNLGHQILCLACFESLILCGTENGELEIWDIEKASVLSAIKGHNEPVTCIEVGRKCVLTGDKGGGICVWKPG
ncbi:protein FAN-like [Saccostrea echinata]|uniref:protein FAN-like n=1 Tax=Saccostrea echinata TaxID=191078 RepID=UPI002A8049E5|nr:protein FAN-like [Saccostrea echinata]